MLIFKYVLDYLCGTFMPLHYITSSLESNNLFYFIYFPFWTKGLYLRRWLWLCFHIKVDKWNNTEVIKITWPAKSLGITRSLYKNTTIITMCPLSNFCIEILCNAPIQTQVDHSIKPCGGVLKHNNIQMLSL